MEQTVSFFNPVNKANIHGNTPLHYVCYWRMEELAELLVHRGASIHLMNNFKQTPLEKTSFFLKEKRIAITPQDKPLEMAVPSVPEAAPVVTVLDWIIEAKDIQLLEILSDSPMDVLYHGKFKTKNVVVRIPNVTTMTDTDLAHVKSELTCIRKISHVNLLPLLCTCLTYPDYCYAIEYTTLGSLWDFIFNSEVEMSPSYSIELAIQVAHGLLALHEAKPPIVHGNLKSLNILVN